MSEFHPNRTSPVRTKPGLTKRRILESWPLLVWVGIGVVAFWTYSSGVVFTRMNGAVDVDHQYVAPAEDGRLLKVLVKQGDIVAPGAVVAEMDSRQVKHQMLALVQGIAASRREEILQLERTRLSLQSELRGYEITKAEDSGKLESLGRDLERGQKVVTLPGTGSGSAPLSFSKIPAVELASLSADLAEVAARQEALTNSIQSVTKDAGRVDGLIAKIEEDIKNATSAASGEVTPEVLAALTVSERGDLLELKALLDGCQLRAPKGGIVEKVGKLEGAFVVAGESVVEVVAEPGRIVAFLPQDQLANVKTGTRVWVTPSHDRNAIYESNVVSIGSRVYSLLDPTSSMRNTRVYGRNVTIALPEKAIAAGTDSPLLVPGQTVIVHTRPPGEVPIMDRLFRSDAPDAR